MAVVSRCLKFTLKTAYEDVESDCCGTDPGNTQRVCIDSEYCIRAATPENVSEFLNGILAVNAPTMAKPVADYFASQFTALMKVGALGTFNECKQFDEVDAKGIEITDGFSLCVCMSSIDSRRRRRACICDNSKSAPKCCGSK